MTVSAVILKDSMNSIGRAGVLDEEPVSLASAFC